MADLFDTSATSPDSVLPVGDPGDETARRYSYQWMYAAVICCMLLDKTEDGTEVFCEQHEDILIKHDDGTYSGLQIKTRSLAGPLWRASDESVTSSFARFVQLEAMFPGQFRTFRFLTNHPLQASQNGQDLRHVLAIIKNAGSASGLPPPALKFLKRVSEESGKSQSIAFAALRKSGVSDELPKLRDIGAQLVSTLSAVWEGSKDCTYESVQRAARALATECQRASSLAHQDLLPAYVSAAADPTQTELVARIGNKRFDLDRVLNLLERGKDEAASLNGDPNCLPEPGAGVTDLLLRKLDAGGFSVVSRNSAADLRDKAEYLALVWTKKHGRQQGLQMYTHIRSLMLSDCAAAFEESKDKSAQFGLRMLANLRKRILARRTGSTQLYDCSDEHLQGISFTLTSECKVQWSLDRPWEVT